MCRRSRAETGPDRVGRAHPPGLTLVELLVVLLLLGVVAGVVAPALSPPAPVGGQAAARELVAALGHARARAVADGVEVALLMDLGTGAYAVVALLGPGEPTDTVRVGVLPLGVAGLHGPPGVPAAFVFDLMGRARGPWLTVREGSVDYEIQVDPWTGRAAVAP
jgi:prepilin-type N-terminal cleavage/methylation domain-containing protein